MIRFFGHNKLLHGTDGMSGSHYRGRTVGVDDSFIWLCEDAPVWNEKHARINPVFVGLENLRALKWACWSAKLTDKQVEDIFWNNAAELFGLD